MKKVAIKKSIEGGKFQTVVLDQKLVNALSEFNRANDTYVYLLITKSIITIGDEVHNKLVQIIEDCKAIFKEYSLDKYDIRANYLFDKSVLIDDKEELFK